MLGRLRMGMGLGLAVAALLSAPRSAAAQAAAADTARINVYLDCQTFGCDQNFFRTEILFVNWVTERQAADVHILVTGQQSGGGGRQLTLAFLGLQRFQGEDSELTYAAAGDATQDEIRRGLADNFKLGLVRYAATTSARPQLRVTYTATSTAAALPVNDPWNRWVFQIGMNGNASGESSSGFFSINGNASANRVTDAWKVSFGGNYNRQRSRYQISTGELITIRKNWSGNGLVVKSLTPRWSAGVRGTLGSISTQNQDLYVTVGTGIEYNIVPYSESTRRLLTYQHLLTVNHFQWADTTLYGEISETRPGHSGIAAIQLTQPWGNVRLNLTGTQYFHDPSKYRLTVGGNMNWRIFRGFSFNFGGNYAKVKDQLFLPKGTLTDDQILTQQQQLATSYSYFTFFGLSYRFGSVNNNTVNPRFGPDGGGGGGGGQMF